MEDLEQLIIDMKESLEREIGSLRSEMREGFARINSRFDLQAQRLDRHGALWQTGRRWSCKMDDWAERSTSLWRRRNARSPNCALEWIGSSGHSKTASSNYRAFRSALSKPGSDLSSASRAIVSESRI